MSSLCEACEKFFQQWGKLHQIGFKGIVNSTRDMSELILKATKGCQFCFTLQACTPAKVKSIVNDNQGMKPRLSIDLKGKEIRGMMLHIIKLELGVATVEICAIPVSDQLTISKRSEISLRNNSEHSLKLAASWLTGCIDNHQCQSMSAKAFPIRTLPSRLICVRQPDRPYLCSMAKLPANKRYTTLSHCWGSMVQFTLLTTNIEALRNHIPFDQLSKTFQHACFLVKRFEFDHLWIDSLCIMQDNAEDWQIESSMMASVYGCSSLNLAASHARDGTVGCFVDRKPEDVVPCQVAIPHQDHEQLFVCVPADFYRRELLGTSLGRRAWAFQERLLAPRTLYFSESQIFWGCQQLEACESFPDGMPPAVCMDINFHTHDGGIASNPTMHGLLKTRRGIWSDAVLAYSIGLLTKQEDKLVAISGVARLMQEVEFDMYHAGVWRKNMEWQLLWSVNSAPQETNTPGTSTKALAYRAPSWSWAAAEGVIRQLFPDPTPNVTKGYQLCIEIVAAITIPLDPGNEFGSITDGWLRVASCGILQVQRLADHSHNNTIIIDYRTPERHFAGKESSKDNKEWQSLKLQVIWDWPSEIYHYYSLFYLPVWADRASYFAYGKPARFGGLILIPSEMRSDSVGENLGHIYKRVGRASSKYEDGLDEYGLEAQQRDFVRMHQHAPDAKKHESIFLV
ncbi:HET-domain-containing protein [Acephala macrosclerotiorum]|nr:HET-domain-containing protein [Acephala macrosclerotiorum]